MSGGPPAVCLEGVRVEVDGRALLQVDALAVMPGERVALVGANGAGKSTLLRVLTGLAPAVRGRVQVLGRDIGPGAAQPPGRAGWRALRAEIGQVMQGLHLVARLSARENVLIGALSRHAALPAWRGWTRLYPAALVAEADAALASLGLAGREDTRADRLSGGERQKVVIARLLLQRPRLVLADEPTAALDPAATEVAVEALMRAAAQAALVSVVHDPALLPSLADRVIGLEGGRIAFDLPVARLDAERLAELYRRPATGTGSATPMQSTSPSSSPSPSRRESTMPARVVAAVVGTFALLAGTGAADAQSAAQRVGDFASAGDEPPAPWRSIRFDERIPATRYRTLTWDGVAAVEARAEGSMSLLARPIDVDLQATPMLCWRWRVDGVPATADMATKAGDDYAARVYVAFGLPAQVMGLGVRAQLALARRLYGDHVPDAAINYVWDNRQPIGTRRPNAYTDRTLMVVQRSGAAQAGGWLTERVDVLAEASRAFGTDRPVARLLAIASDTDNTGERARAGFADLHFVARDAPCAFPAAREGR